VGATTAVRITGAARGSLTLPLAITDGMVDGVVWVPSHSPGSNVNRDLGVGAGASVTVKGGEAR
jgi:NADH-quinone oxidoreductase subunit G